VTWRHVRAGLILAHVLAVVLSSLPSPSGGLNRKNWQDPTVQAELRAWADRFGMEPAAFEDRIYEVGVRWQGALDAVQAPVSVYEDWTKQGQSWKMFVAPHRFPARMQLQVMETGEWRTVFQERSTEFTWKAGIFGLERMRASIFRWSWPAYQRYWKKACESLAPRLLADFPEATAVRCRFVKARSPSPEEARSGAPAEETAVYPYVVKR
jgi:hypothetical protein